MTSEEISKLVDIGGNFGVRAIKATGGELLTRSDIIEILQSIASKPFVEDLSIVTNGILLSKFALDLFESGVNRINVSLDTLDPDRYRFLSKGNMSPVLHGITAVTKLKFSLLKINMLILKNLNEEEFVHMIKFIESLLHSSKTPIHLQLIELVQTSVIGNDFFNKYFVNLREKFRPWLINNSSSRFFRRKNMRECFTLTSGLVIELVTPTHNSAFCEHCNRIRITADGYLKPCLMREDNLIDIIGPMRLGASSEKLIELFQKSILLKSPYWLNHLNKSNYQ
jgi:cyclic pyranopterin phosphate synthase